VASKKGFTESPPNLPKQITFSPPAPRAFYLDARIELNRVVDGKAHLLEFGDKDIVVDRVPYLVNNKVHRHPTHKATINSQEGLIKFFKDFHPGYHQSKNDEHLKILTNCLTESQRSDLRHINQCALGGGCTLCIMGQTIMVKESIGKSFRNHVIYNVFHLNDNELIDPQLVPTSSLLADHKAWLTGQHYYTSMSLASNARANLMQDCKDGYFPLNLLDPKILKLFYESVKHPSFRSFVIGLSHNLIVSDLVRCYLHILKYSISPSLSYGKYIWDTDYHTDAAYCACRIWINLDKMPLSPLNIRVGGWVFPPNKDTFLPSWHIGIAYPYGKIDSCVVDLPTLWYLVEELKMKLGKDLGIIEGVWFIPYSKVQAWRLWCSKIEHSLQMFPTEKWRYQIAPTGGKFPRGKKVGEFQYQYQWEALSTESPIILAHLFSMTKILSILGAKQGKAIKNLAVDGWTGNKSNISQIGPLQIGCVQYGPFPVKNTPVELFYQFDPVRHDEITDIKETDKYMWLPRARACPDAQGIVFTSPSTFSFKEKWDDPQYIGIPLIREQLLIPSMHDFIPDTPVTKVGDTLDGEITGHQPNVNNIPLNKVLRSHIQEVPLDV
jgi:hypothetical protein